MSSNEMSNIIKAIVDGRDTGGHQKYIGAYLTTTGARSMANQIKFVKERPTQYPSTLEKFFKDFNVDPKLQNDTEYLKTIYDGYEEWLEKAIKEFAQAGKGFRHISGMAMDVSVKNLSNDSKKKLFNELVDKGLYIILESVNGSKSQYNVSIERANVFHVEFKQGLKQHKYHI